MTPPTLTPEQSGRICRRMVWWLNTYCAYFDEYNMVQFAYHDAEMRDAMRPFGIALPDPDPEHPRKWPQSKMDALQKRAAIWLSDTADQVFDGLILTRDKQGWCSISAVEGRAA